MEFEFEHTLRKLPQYLRIMSFQNECVKISIDYRIYFIHSNMINELMRGV